ncbi:MAG: DUF2784 family protein [Microcoleaceae cyanobacterium]
MNWRSTLISGLKFSHLAILLFICFGWALPNPFLWQIHLIFVPLTVLQWQFNQGTCILTNWENRLAGASAAKSQQQGQFTRSLLSRCCNPLPSDRTLKFIIYGVILLAWSLSGIRLWLVRGL